MIKRIVRWSFKGPKQLPFFLIWEEFSDEGEVTFARVIFNSRNWIGV